MDIKESKEYKAAVALQSLFFVEPFCIDAKFGFFQYFEVQL